MAKSQQGAQEGAQERAGQVDLADAPGMPEGAAMTRRR